MAARLDGGAGGRTQLPAKAATAQPGGFLRRLARAACRTAATRSLECWLTSSSELRSQPGLPPPSANSGRCSTAAGGDGRGGRRRALCAPASGPRGADSPSALLSAGRRRWPAPVLEWELARPPPGEATPPPSPLVLDLVGVSPKPGGRGAGGFAHAASVSTPISGSGAARNSANSVYGRTRSRTGLR